MLTVESIAPDETMQQAGPTFERGLSTLRDAPGLRSAIPAGPLTKPAENHPAVRAWKRLRPDALDVDRVDVLKFRNAKKSTVYRLYAAGPGGASIIAKRCLAGPARVERLIYEEVLPAICFKPPLHYYGFEADRNQNYAWLFLEEARGMGYSPLDPMHRQLAGRWLAELHCAGVPAEIQRRLPSREPAHYLQSLRDCRRILQDHLSHNPALSDEYAGVFSRMARHLEALESQWTQLEGICGPIPRTLVHGDLIVKNLGIREGDSGPELLVFDWEYSGWGVAAADLAQSPHGGARPDLRVYWSGLVQAYPHITFDAVRQAAACGDVFRLVEEMRWTMTMCDFASHEFLLKPAMELEYYEKPLMEALHEMEMVRK